MKTDENNFASNTLSKEEIFKNTTKETLCRCSVNAENVKAENANTENANTETVFYQVWSTMKVGVDSGKPW